MGTYLAANANIVIRVANDAVKLVGFSSDNVIDENNAIVKMVQHGFHTAFSIIQAWYTEDGIQKVMPLFNTAMFHAQKYANFKSDNKITWCVIDVTSSTVAHLAMFNFLNAGIAAFLTTARCTAEILNENNDKELYTTILWTIDTANVFNNFVNTPSVVVKILEMIKLSYLDTQPVDTLYEKIDDNVELAGQDIIDAHNEL